MTSSMKRREYYERLGLDESASNGMLHLLNKFNVYFRFRKRGVYSHDRRVLSTPVGYSHDDQSEARYPSHVAYRTM